MSNEIWKRPSNLKYPNTFSKFRATDTDGSDKLIEYQVIDVPESRYEEACAFMVRHFVPYEPKLVSRDAQNDPKVCEDYYYRYLDAIKQKVSVACIKTDSDDFIGVNILEVYGRNKQNCDFKPQSKTCLDILEAVDYIEDAADLFNRHNVDYYLSGTALAIDPQYRGRGIATEIIKARISMLHFYNLRLTSTGFSSIGAQIAARKAGCLIDFGISYDELSKIRPNWSFLGTETDSYIQMSLKI